jgi:carbonic anhydrase/acetyltransferase-like protein (isoleucine patch superfamily)
VADGASVWYGAMIRSDEGSVSVSSGAVIGDSAVVRASAGASAAVETGAQVLAAAVVDSAVVQSGAVVGYAARIAPGAVIGAGSVVAPGSFVAAGTTVPAGQLWSGVPAAFVRAVSAEEAAAHKQSLETTSALASLHTQQWAKSEEDLVEEAIEHSLDGAHAFPMLENNYALDLAETGRRGVIYNQRE